MMTFLISLARAVDRRIESLEILKKQSVEFEMVEAHDGWLESDLPRHPHCWRIRPTEVAAFYSHAKAMRRVLECGLPYGLILEDDFSFYPEFNITAVESALPPEFDFVSLHDLRVPEWDLEVSENGTAFHRLNRYGLMAVGYVVSARFVEFFLKHCLPCRVPIDHQFRQLSESRVGLQFYQAAKPSITGRGVPSTL